MIYFDNAATTFPKPESVYRAAENAMRIYGGNPGRSSHRLSFMAGKAVYECRERIAELFDSKPENVAFTLNATYAFNIAYNALKRRSGHTLISSFEHNAVLRTVSTGGKYEVFGALGDDVSILNNFKRSLNNAPSLVCVSHASNICGAVMPVNEIGKLCKIRNIPFIIDASQSGGKVKLSINDSSASAIIAPSHKGLYGIQGAGFVIFSDEYADKAGLMPEFIYGGNGINSLEKTMPDFLPERYEAGTLPTPAIMSLSAGINEINDIGIDEIYYHEEYLGKYLKEGLSVIRGTEIYGENYCGGTVLFNLRGMQSEALSEYLDRCGICVRGGYHCCPLGHESLRTPQGGAVRASFSYYNNRAEVDKLLHAISNKVKKTAFV